jgi:hypothetical protein
MLSKSACVELSEKTAGSICGIFGGAILRMTNGGDSLSVATKVKNTVFGTGLENSYHANGCRINVTQILSRPLELVDNCLGW